MYDLPDDEIYEYEEGKYFDIGVKYTVFQIAWIPLYQKENAELVGYIGNGDTYLALDEEDLAALAVLNDLENWNRYAKLSFWDAWGGKLLAGLILLLIIGGYIYGRNDKEDEEDPENAAA